MRDSCCRNRHRYVILVEEKEGIFFKTTIILFLLSVPVWAALAYVVFLIIKALRKYIRSEPLRLERAEQAKTLGETLKRRRTACKMTQEFVAEALGVSRQAVSKWENGTSDPITSNLIALAKLYGISAEELLKNVEHSAGTTKPNESSERTV